MLIPYRIADEDREGDRQRNWAWLQAYWQNELPLAEVVIGHYEGFPYSKTSAVNDAARRAHGDVFVILDADCYLSGRVIMECARRIRRAEDRDRHLWFVPYRHMYRLPPGPTQEVLDSDPAHPLRFGFPYHVDDGYGAPGIDGHHYGAMAMIMSREAFWTIGGMDRRYKGWGSEDVTFMFAMDTLWGRHQTTNNDIFHLYHAGIGDNWTTRQWKGQEGYMPLKNLAMRYSRARFDLERMRHLVDEGTEPGEGGWWDRALRFVRIRRV